MWILIALLSVAGILQYYAMKHALEDLYYNCEPSKLLAAPDEIFDYVTTIKNGSWRFVPYLKITESMPDSVTVHNEEAVIEDYSFMNEIWHISSLFLMPRSAIVRRVPISFPARGRYVFSRSKLQCGDFLGLKDKSHNIEHKREMIIYPNPADYNYVIRQLGGFFGDISVRRFIIEDPILTVGFSEYTGREPMKAISWPQSAKAGRMMVKTFDYTTELSVSLVLNIEGSPEEIEKSLALTHTVCQILEKKRIKYDFYTNLIANGSRLSWTHIAEGLGPRHYQYILEGLGRAAYDSNEPVSKLLSRVPDERSVILVTHGKVEELR